MKRFAHYVLAALLCILTLNHPGSCQQECETPVELGFLVDQSGSINVENFEKVKSFILGVIAGFNASREGTHIGIIKYSTDATTVLRFNEFEDPDFDYANLNQTLQKALDLPSGGKTRIDLALKKADRDLFSDASKYRTFVPKILLVLTDGQQTRGEGIPERNLFAAAKSLSAKGVEVYVLGVGENVNIPELLQIASDKDGNVYLAEDFDDLSVQVGGLLESFCKVCRRNVDVAFLIPTANHVGEKGLQDIKLVINAVLSTFGIKKYRGVHVGFMTCTEVGEIIMKFDDYHNRKEIRNVLESLKLKTKRKATKLGNCLKDASTNLFDVRGGVRNFVDKYLIVIGDGRASFLQQSVRTPLSSLKNQGVKILSWARSSSRSAVDRMRKISSDPKDIWFRQMQRREVQNAGFFGRSISEIICKEKEGKCPYAEIPETCTGNDVFHECSSDEDTVSPCPEETKCCQVGCERQCLAPVSDCFNPVEIALLVDTSGTRGALENENTLKEFKEFAKELLHSFSITETSGRVALVTYNNESKLHKMFGSGPNFWDVEQKINSLVLSNQADRNLAEALEFTRENVFSLKGGIRQSVPRVLIVLSTGRPTTTSSSLSQAAIKLKDSGVQIWGVDANGDSPNYMNEIVSQSIFFYPSLNELENFQDNFVSTVCSTKDGTCHSPLCSHDLENECKDDYVCPGQQKCCSGPCTSCVEPKTDCRFPMDLAFIIQDSLDEREFEKVKNTMKGIMKALDIGRTQTWIGIITFNKKAEIKLEFLDNQGNSIEEKRKFLFDQIDNLQASLDRSTTGAEEAFKLAKNRLFTEEAGSHPGEIRNAVFISNDKFEEQEKLAEASLALIWNIDNVLPMVVTEDLYSVPFIENLASPDAEKHVYLATSYDALDQYRNRIAQDICKEGKLKSEMNSAIIVDENVAVRRKRRQAPGIGTGVKPVQGPVTMVKGPVGDLGPLGPKGIKGRVGLPGRKGATGVIGISGEVGKPGVDGNIGAPGQWGLVGPAREVVIEYSGEKGPISDESSLRSAQMNLSKLDNTVYEYQNPKHGAGGERGSEGQQGSIGQDGRRGFSGRSGLCGSGGITGATGRVGRIGLQGSEGYRGGRGLTGPLGPKGSSGNVGNRGPKGIKGPLGDPGEPGLKGQNGEVGIRGKLGTFGDIGGRGVTGLKGLPGLDGKPGFNGFIGRQGIEGVKGIPGVKGEMGLVGIPGERGNGGGQGFQGQMGLPGILGIPGLGGEDGEPGVNGRNGAMGIRGKEGPIGKTGKPGVQGDHGLFGPLGYKGSKGFSGDKGADGSNGEQGEVGRQGSNGDPGDIGEFGHPGTRGEDGVDGLPGTLGPEGGVGEQGRRGIEGEPGSTGDIGPVGRPGPPGPLNRPGLFGGPGVTGEKGVHGDPGFLGRHGKQGQKGFPGDIGEPGFPGSNGPTGLPGSDGSFGFYGTPGNIGLVGVPGPSGPNGQPGRAGQDGETGPRGTPGDKGFLGPPGFPGPAGVAAPPGPIGLPGDPGERNKKGRKGSIGFSGSAGEDGPSGNKGKTGSRGLSGTPGRQGTRGGRGERGEDGDKGFPGPAGPPGKRGRTGPVGTKGSPGEPSMRGKSGVVGRPGPTGSKGVLGNKGDKGDMGRLGRRGPSGRPGNSGESGPAWLLAVDGVKGLKGAMGRVGIAGRPGTSGKTGQPGPQGNSGTLGMPGSQGVSGPIGLPGGVGLPGQKGPSGDSGDPGVAGVFGRTGLAGGEGLLGLQGDAGQKGTPGTGTLPGEPGSRGPKGFQGTIGMSGNMGRKGRKGPKGSIGFRGDKGDKGTQGIVGTNGTNGLPGERGTKGLKGLAGATGKTGVVVHGDIGPPGRNGNIGKPGEDGEPGLAGKNGKQGMQGIPGARGSRGENGERGTNGGKGKIGPAGAPGEAAAKGSQGSRGSPGLPGKSVEGKLGLPGPPGSAGIDGIPGLKGESGTAGLQGQNGFAGLRGENGTSGMIGDSGKAGSKGGKGEIGKPGNNASQGEKGEKGKIGLDGQGEKGDNGTVGLPGPDGARGPQGVVVKGPMGLQGEAGKKGISGIQGPPGPPGPQGPHPISFNGTTISFRHNETHFGYINTSLQNTTISKRYYSLQLNMALYKRPNGTKTFPSLTCADLYKNYPTLESGQYWIDPNGGAHEDAEQVYCDFANNATCLDPVRKKVKNKKWFTGSDGYKWFTEELDDAPDADKFNYTFDVVQLQMLQLQSNEAWQEITYHCLNSVAWSNTSSMFEHSIRLQGDDDLEFHSQMPRKLRPITIEDNCQIKDDQWNKTIIEVRSRNSIHLPIRDVAVYDVGDDGEEFGLELGRVCFTP